MVLKYSESHIIQEASTLLKRGEVIIAPCDTIYGFLGIVPDTEEKIRVIKGREENKPFLCLVHNYKLIQKICMDPDLDFLRCLWPGAFTIILSIKSEFRAIYGESLGFRLPDNVFLQKLIELTGKPLYSTSVNRAGESALIEISEIITNFENEVSLIIDGGALNGQPSTVVLALKQPFKVLRAGAGQIPENLLQSHFS